MRRYPLPRRAAHGCAAATPLFPALLAAAFLITLITAPVPAHARIFAGPAYRTEAVSLPACPPPGFTSVPDLNLSAYAAAPWYVQMQAPLSYQGEDPRDYLYCVRATYVPLGPDDLPLGVDPRVITGVPRDQDQDQDSQDQDDQDDQQVTPIFQVVNYANRGRVNGPPVGTGLASSSGRLLGAPLLPAQLVALPDPEARGTPQAASQLLVGPPNNLPGLLNWGWRLGYGQYWVVAVMPSNDTELGYDWAIVSGGPPQFSSSRGCLTLLPPPPPRGPGLGFATNFFGWLGWSAQAHAAKVASLTRGSSSGLWLLSRTPVDAQGTREMLRTAQDLGFDTSVLLPVQQRGCNYSEPASSAPSPAPSAPAAAPPPFPPAAAAAPPPPPQPAPQAPPLPPAAPPAPSSQQQAAATVAAQAAALERGQPQPPPTGLSRPAPQTPATPGK